MLFTILFMYVCAMALAPFIVYTMYVMYTGDMQREQAAAARVAASTPSHAPTATITPAEVDGSQALPATGVPASLRSA